MFPRTKSYSTRTTLPILPDVPNIYVPYVYTVSVGNSIDIGATRRDGGMGLLLLLLLVGFVFCRPEI